MIDNFDPDQLHPFMCNELLSYQEIVLIMSMDGLYDYMCIYVILTIGVGSFS